MVLPEREKREKLPQEDGGALRGVGGAFLGALAGAAVWFLLRRFTGFFVGWAGFVVAGAAWLGYRLLRGKRSRRFATAMTLLFSIVLLAAAELLASLLLLCADPALRQEAAASGAEILPYAVSVLRLPERIAPSLSNIRMGVLFAVLGYIAVRPRIQSYTGQIYDPFGDLAAAKSAEPETVARDLRSFSVVEARSARIFLRVLGAACLAAAVVGAVNAAAKPPQTRLLFAAAAVAIAVGGVWLLLSSRRRIDVGDEKLTYLPPLGAARTVPVGEIAAMRTEADVCRLCDAGGRELLSFALNMENAAQLRQYLQEHGIGRTAGND